jgi:Alkylmercury lyase
MLANLVILTAEELKALNPLERQVARRAARQQPLVQLILRIFLRDGGPIPVADITGASPDGDVESALVRFDDEDIIRVRAGQIDLAYPLSALPTPFRVRLPRGRQRYACCATDALGMAPMVGGSVEIESTCHHCGEALKFTATPHGVGPEAEGVMVWFGKRGDEGCKAFDSL